MWTFGKVKHVPTTLNMLTKDQTICTFVNSTKQNYENNSIETNLNSIWFELNLY